MPLLALFPIYYNKKKKKIFETILFLHDRTFEVPYEANCDKWINII